MNLLTPVLLLATITVEEVLSSRFHGPTALPVVLNNGYLADTYEVAAARRSHLATLSHQTHGGSHEHHEGSRYSHDQHGDLRYHGPTAVPHVLHDGHIADTHEVAAAKAEHYAAVAKARAHGGYYHGGDYSAQYSGTSGGPHGHGTHTSYHGPIAKPVVLPSGYLADTNEVTHAKQQHLRLLRTSQSGHHIVS